MWKQAFWFALLGSMVAVLASGVDDLPVRGESFTFYDGGTSLTSRYHGGVWSEVGQTAAVGAVISALVGAVVYGCGARMVVDAGSGVGRVVLAGLAGTVLGLSPVLVLVVGTVSGMRSGESWAIEPPLLLTLYGISAVLAYCTAVCGVYLSLRVAEDDLTVRTTAHTAIVLPVGALAATLTGVGTAWLYDFTTTATTIAMICIVVALVLSAAFAGARLWARGRIPGAAGLTV